MKLQHHAFAKAAIAATLTATALSSCTALGQTKPSDPDSVATNQQAAARQLINRGPEDDPNMPNLPYALPNAPLFWTPGSNHSPQVNFTKYPQGPGTYLGFNDKGSWIKNDADGKVYVWNLKDRSLTMGAANEYEVPMDLRNPSDILKGRMLARAGQGKPSTTVPNNNGRTTPYIPPNAAGAGNAPHAAGEGRTETVGANPAGTSKAFKGSGAAISAGVLTFTLDDPSSSDNGKQMSFSVARSAMNNPNAANSNGIAGAWLGEDPKNKDVIVSLYVQGEGGAVSGTVMTGLAAEALKRMMNANRPH